MIVPSAIETQIDAPDDFRDEINGSINLYEILDVPTDADLKSIRKRIGVLFLEAQCNTDHRSFRRRFYYRELTEVVLPKARHILLDAERRENYNQSLGIKSLFTTSLSPVSSSAKTSTTPIEYSNAAPASAAGAVEAIGGIAVSDGHSTAPPKSETTPGAVKIADNAATAVSVIGHGTAPDHLKMDAERVERRRDFKRRELIKQELVAVGTRWALIVGALSFALATFLLLGAGVTLQVQALRLASLPIALVCAAFCARFAHRKARKSTITLLSKMPYEQLLQRCANM